MRKEATLEQWKELYEVGLEIKKLEPWCYMWDMDIISVKLPDQEEPCFFSILGHGGDCYGISTFVGYAGLKDFIAIAESAKHGMPFEYIMQEQTNLSCYFGSREEVPEGQKKVIKELGYKFKGKNQWLYFQSFKKGYMPYILDEQETVYLTESLKQLIEAFKAYDNAELDVNFDNGEILSRYFDKDKNQWVNEAAQLPFYNVNYPLLVLQDDILKAKLKKQPRTSTKLEIDMTYLHVTVKDKNFDRPVNPKLILMMDHLAGVVYTREMVTPMDVETQVLVHMLIEFIMTKGRPKQIFIRNPYIASLIEDTCKLCAIELTINAKLKAVDVFLKEFNRKDYKVEK